MPEEKAAGGQAPVSRTRREFLADAILTLGVVCGLGGLAFRMAQFLYPVVPPVKLVKVLAGKLDEIPPDGAKVLKVALGPVILERIGARVRARSAICTHLGCIVQWHPEPREFICPCHHGVYDFNGNVVSGPPPRPLERFKAAVEGQNVFVWMKSRQGQGAA